MTSHELARRLLELPEKTVQIAALRVEEIERVVEAATDVETAYFTSPRNVTKIDRAMNGLNAALAALDAGAKETT